MKHQKNPSVESVIAKKLNECGISKELLGYRFLIMAIRIALDDQDAVSKIGKKIYTPMSEYYNITTQRISMEIAQAIETAFVLGYLKGFFDNPNIYEKPKTPDFISFIVGSIPPEYKNQENKTTACR